MDKTLISKSTALRLVVPTTTGHRYVTPDTPPERLVAALLRDAPEGVVGRRAQRRQEQS